MAKATMTQIMDYVNYVRKVDLTIAKSGYSYIRIENHLALLALGYERGTLITDMAKEIIKEYP